MFSQPSEKHARNTFYHRNMSWLLVLVSQVFAVFMNTAAKFLETETSAISPLQILAVRMVFTFCVSSLILWHRPSDDFPFGKKELRPLLILRAVGGVLAAIGFYSSLKYMPLSEATVLNFLAPLGTCCMVALMSSGSFTGPDITSATLSIAGVLLVARPPFLFGQEHSDSDSILESGSHLVGIGFAMVGAVGGVCAYTTVRVIGKRAHPLMSVNYFAAALLLVSIVAFEVYPELEFKWRIHFTHWILLILIAVLGFLMEFTLTAGISQEKSHRATYMIYSQALVAFVIDGIIWHKIPGVLSLVGCLLISVGLAVITLLNSSNSGVAYYELEYLDTKQEAEELLSVGDSFRHI